MTADDVYTASGYPVTTEKITLETVGVVTHKTYPHEGLQFFYSMGLPRLMEIYQTVYDRHLSD